MTAFHFLMHPLQFEELRIKAVDSDQGMLPDCRLDLAIRIRTCLLHLPPLVYAPLDADRQHRRTDPPVIGAADLVEKSPIAVRGGKQLDLAKIGAAEIAKLHQSPEQLRVGPRAPRRCWLPASRGRPAAYLNDP